MSTCEHTTKVYCILCMPNLEIPGVYNNSLDNAIDRMHDVYMLPSARVAFDYIVAQARIAQGVHVGWFTEIGGNLHYLSGTVDPREVHDNGKPYRRAYAERKE